MKRLKILKQIQNKNDMWKVYVLMAIVVIILSIYWVKGITDMHEEHPDYKGEELFGEGFNFDDKEEEKKK